jgi:hypothetical protein
MTKLRFLFFLGAFAALLTASDCVPDDDDDDVVADDDDVVVDDDDATGDDDDVTPPDPFVISGEVIALDRDTGVVLTPEQYAARSGGIIVYALPDSGNLGVIHDKDTLIDGPGPYEIALNVLGPFEIVAVADENMNWFIDSDDVAREFAFNPLAGAGEDIEGVNIYIDLPIPNPFGDDDDDDNGDDDDDGGPGDDDDDGGPGDDDDDGGPGDDDDDGGPGDDDDDDDDDDTTDVCWSTTLSGDVNIYDLPENTVAITTNSADLTQGPIEWQMRDGSGPWTFSLPCDGDISLLAYLDADGNQFFEPSDPLGVPDGNPFTLGIGNVYGIQIDIPAQEVIEPPVPPAYVPLTGTVLYDGFTTGDILVHAAHVTIDGYLFSMATLAAPGAFSLIAPADTDEVLVWAVLDADGDGGFDLEIDPFDSDGPMNTGLGVSSITLDLGEAPTGTFTGTVTYEGPVAPADKLNIGVFDTPVWDPSQGPPLQVVVEQNPTFPYDFSFDEIEAGTYWVGTYLDVGGDSPEGAGPGDPGYNGGPYLLPPGGAVTDILLPLPN